LPAGRRGPLVSRGPYASILPVYQQRDWGPGMVKCVGPTRCLMRPWVETLYTTDSTQSDRHTLHDGLVRTWYGRQRCSDVAATLSTCCHNIYYTIRDAVLINVHGCMRSKADISQLIPHETTKKWGKRTRTVSKCDVIFQRTGST